MLKVYSWGEESVRKSDPWKGESIERQQVERGMHTCVGRKTQFREAQKLLEVDCGREPVNAGSLSPVI